MRHLMGLAAQPVLSTAMSSSVGGGGNIICMVCLRAHRTDSLSNIVPP